MMTTLQDKDLTGYVGFANLPNQVFRKSVKRGFEFSLMVVGKIGKNCKLIVRGTLVFSLPNTTAHYSWTLNQSFKIDYTNYWRWQWCLWCIFTHVQIINSTVGASGLGKSTLINSLFLSSIYEDDKYPETGCRLPQTVKVSTGCRTPQTVKVSTVFYCYTWRSAVNN